MPVCPNPLDATPDAPAMISDPRIFNFVIMALYALNAARWAYEGKWADTCYWLSALSITATVTFGYAH